MRRDPGERRPALVLVDGPSGSGKSTLADVLFRDGDAAAGLTPGAQLLRLDDVYPGWDGLEAASRHLEHHVVDEMRPGGRPRWRRWDWTADAPAEWHDLDPERPLVVEGCGSLTRAAARRATHRIWVEADDAVRRARAIARDGESFAVEWERWDAQWRAHVAREDPRALADVVVRTDAVAAAG
ncbi:AAA family ATPase [Clavibacter nebraskensis]|uniref:ATP-binding protein n=2 Tax=Clavibacter nebraskensis TaxID=31963 RepID=A0A399P0H0_9MICO|nr:AAA family ATPase [Clavibacter nebraskensis]KXU20606.1 ATP-binding protein [Clavibacter nebraskensis]OAH22176.1 ATP-binding protein [Clavibacter nebraskensis]QGV66589.1 ATP-binding protein [Clavibacter nebraskensis]RII99189.1 ATP-binding protein [Clavibacter nebraskensis]UKF27233.1 ATP-binding protein [Clavibacter nebraskensis]